MSQKQTPKAKVDEAKAKSQNHAQNPGAAGQPSAEPENEIISTLEAEKDPRGGPREKLSDENIEKIRKLWRKGASVAVIEEFTPWSQTAILKYTKGIPQNRDFDENSPGPKTLDGTPTARSLLD